VDLVTLFLNACITILSGGLLVLTVVGYVKNRNAKLLFVVVAFLLFLVKGVVLSLGVFVRGYSHVLENPYFGLFDVFILLLLFVSTLKR